MATEDNPPNQHLIYHTAGSRLDIISIYQYNEVTYGEAHAERYLDFLDTQISNLAQYPTTGHKIEQYPQIRVHTAKIRPRGTANGHRIFYREVIGGIEIIRILHTAMNWPDHIDGNL